MRGYRLRELKAPNYFLSAAMNDCKGPVFLFSEYGDIYNLSSRFSFYIAFSALLSHHSTGLFLYCPLESDLAILKDYYDPTVSLEVELANGNT